MTLLQREPVIEAVSVAAPPARRHAAPPVSSTVLPSGVRSASWRWPARLSFADLRVRVAIALVAIGAILAAGLVVNAVRSRDTVVLSLDGTTTLVASDAATVGDLLRAQGITLTARDIVTPAPGTPLPGVPEVTVDRARQVDVTVDGSSRTVWTTSEDVAGLLGQLGVSDQAYVSMSPLSPLPLTGASVTVRSPKTVTLLADGTSQQLTTTATTVGQALAAADVGYVSGDQVSVPLSSPVVAGATYRLVRVEVAQLVQQTPLVAQVTWVKRANLPSGSSELITSGANGVRQRTLRVRYQDGVAVASTVLSDTVLSAPVRWVIAVGTGPGGGSGGATGSGSGYGSVGIPGVTYLTTFVPATGKVVGRAPNFAALAMCETHARPRAVSPTGKYRGMYQFDLRTWHGVGGVGDPIDATPAEQTYRAQLLYDNRGRAPWPYCGRFL